MNVSAIKDSWPVHPAAPLWPWVIWGMGVLFYGFTSYQRVAPGVMVNELMLDFSANAVILANLSAVFFYSYALMQIPAGVLIDRFGPRLVLVASAVGAGMGCFLFAWSSSLPMAFGGRLIIGITCGFSWVGALKLAMIWLPPNRFAMASGLTLFCGMLFAVAGQAPIALLVEALGWRGTMLVSGGIVMILGVCIWLLAKNIPYHGSDDVANSFNRSAPLLYGLGQVLKEPQNWLIALFWGATAGPMLSFAGLWGVSYIMIRYGLERPVAALVVSTLLIGWGVGGPVGGWVSDYLGRRKVPLLISTTFALVTWIALLYVPDLPLEGVVVLLLINGIASGAGIINVALARENNPAEFGGTVLALINVFSPISGAIFQLLVGFLLDVQWDGLMKSGIRVYPEDAYVSSLIIFPVSLVFALGLVCFFSESYSRYLSQAISPSINADGRVRATK